MAGKLLAFKHVSSWRGTREPDPRLPTKRMKITSFGMVLQVPIRTYLIGKPQATHSSLLGSPPFVVSRFPIDTFSILQRTLRSSPALDTRRLGERNQHHAVQKINGLHMSWMCGSVSSVFGGRSEAVFINYRLRRGRKWLFNSRCRVDRVTTEAHS